MKAREIIPSVRDFDLRQDDISAMHSLFQDRTEAIIDDLDRLKIAIYTVHGRVSKSGDKGIWNSFCDPETVEETGVNEFNAVIDALKAIDNRKTLKDNTGEIEKLRQATEALTKKLELKGFWKALALAKKFIGTIGEALTYLGIPCAFGIGGAALGSLSTHPVAPVIGAALGVTEGGKRAAKWTEQASNFISSSACFLPSAYRASKAAGLHEAVVEAEARVTPTLGSG